MGSRCVELSEAFLEGFVWILLRGKLNESNYLGDISKVEGSHRRTGAENKHCQLSKLEASGYGEYRDRAQTIYFMRAWL